MKILLLSAFAAFAIASVNAQTPITIDAGDMPVAGDTLRYSVATAAATGLNYSATGPNFTWNFSTLVPESQAILKYQTAASVDQAYASASFSGAYGYKIADSLPGAPISVRDIYNFFNKKPASSPTRFVIEGFGAKVGTVIPIAYTDEDEVYNFPLTYQRQDSTTFLLTYNGIAYFAQKGYRKTTVDGWGTITTPYTSSPVAVIRVRSEVSEIDSFNFLGTGQTIPRNYVEYKWLAKGEHYPLLVITTDKAGSAESVNSVHYRDTRRANVGINNIGAPVTVLTAFPNPAQRHLTIKIPDTWHDYRISVYDAAGRLVSTARNEPTVKTEAYVPGVYAVMVECAGAIGVAQFTKQ